VRSEREKSERENKAVEERLYQSTKFCGESSLFVVPEVPFHVAIQKRVVRAEDDAKAQQLPQFP
jgi:hypothetical protein